MRQSLFLYHIIIGCINQTQPIFNNVYFEVGEHNGEVVEKTVIYCIQKCQKYVNYCILKC